MFRSVRFNDVTRFTRLVYKLLFLSMSMLEIGVKLLGKLLEFELMKFYKILFLCVEDIFYLYLLRFMPSGNLLKGLTTILLLVSKN